VHGVDWYVNRPPWYSGMAQGLALALFARLWQYTGDASYRRLADLTYNSLRNMGRGTNPWVSWIDARRYLWIEEYPQQLDQTFNGYVFAIIGLYDYAQLTKDPTLYGAVRNADVLALLRGGITTIRAYTPTFRNLGTVSDYCLAHHYRNPKYHPVHVTQLRYLTLITGDRWFDRMADAFAADVR
jgi:D-glucuronyl C5-epimerase C-terminus